MNCKRIRSNGKKINRNENKLPLTYIYATADVLSGYVFRADVADCYVCHEVYKYCRGVSVNQRKLSVEIIDNAKDFEGYPLSSLSEIELETLIKKAESLDEDSRYDEAIDLYEQCVASNYKDKKPYDRLIVLYRKKRQKENEIRVLKLAVKLFKFDQKYEIRLEKINSH